MTDNPRFSLKIKSIALALVLTFACQDLLWANSGLFSPANPFPAGVQPPPIPVSIATVQDAFKARSGKTLYLIQDAHTNESAQRNIAKALEILVEKEKISHVFLEAGWGEVSLSHLRDKAPLKARRKVAGDFLREGVLSGSEYLDITSGQNLNLWGVEDEGLYWKSIEVYKEVSQGREKFRDYLNRIEQTLESLKPRIYNPSLLLFDEKRRSYLEEKISYAEYLEELSSRARSKGISLEYYPYLASLKAIFEQEKGIDFNKANEEQCKALQFFSPEDLEILASTHRQNGFEPFKLGSREHREERGFYAFLKDKIRNLQDFPELSKYLSYLESVENIDPARLLEEQQALESRVYAALSQAADENQLHRISEILNNLKELFNLTLTPDAFEILKSDPAAFDIAALTGFLNLKIMELRHLYERAVFLEGGYEDYVRTAREFYELTLRRDQAFLKNALQKMQEDDIQKAVLIAGGYHSPNLTSLLKQKNISYVTLTPQVLHETNQKRYEALLLGQEPEITDAARSALSDTIGIRPIRLNTPYYERLSTTLSDSQEAPAPSGARLADAESRLQRAIRSLNDRSVWARREAADEIGRMGSAAHTAIPVLIPLLNDRKPDMRIAVVEALGKISQEKEDSVIPALAGRLLDEPNASVRRRILAAFGKFGPKASKTAPLLIRALRDDKDTGVREEAAGALPRLGPEAEPGIPVLMDTLNSSILRLKEAAITALGQYGKAAAPALPALREILRADKRHEVRALAAKAIGLIGEDADQSVRALQAGLKDGRPQVRSASALALGRFGDLASPAVGDLAEIVNDRNKAVRPYAIRALGQIGPAAREALSILKSVRSNRSLRKEADEAIARIEQTSGPRPDDPQGARLAAHRKDGQKWNRRDFGKNIVKWLAGGSLAAYLGYEFLIAEREIKAQENERWLKHRSYPNVQSTVEIFRQTAQWLKANGYPRTDVLEEYIRYAEDSRNVVQLPGKGMFIAKVTDGPSRNIKIVMKPQVIHEILSNIQDAGSQSLFASLFVPILIREAWGFKFMTEKREAVNQYDRDAIEFISKLGERGGDRTALMSLITDKAQEETLNRLSIGSLAPEMFEAILTADYRRWARSKGLFSESKAGKDAQRLTSADTRTYYRNKALQDRHEGNDPRQIFMSDSVELLNRHLEIARGRQMNVTNTSRIWFLYFILQDIRFTRTNGAEGLDPSRVARILTGRESVTAENFEKQINELYPSVENLVNSLINELAPHVEIGGARLAASGDEPDSDDSGGLGEEKKAPDLKSAVLSGFKYFSESMRASGDELAEKLEAKGVNFDDLLRLGTSPGSKDFMKNLDEDTKQLVELYSLMEDFSSNLEATLALLSQGKVMPAMNLITNSRWVLSEILRMRKDFDHIDPALTASHFEKVVDDWTDLVFQDMSLVSYITQVRLAHYDFIEAMDLVALGLEPSADEDQADALAKIGFDLMPLWKKFPERKGEERSPLSEEELLNLIHLAPEFPQTAETLNVIRPEILNNKVLSEDIRLNLAGPQGSLTRASAHLTKADAIRRKYKKFDSGLRLMHSQLRGSPLRQALRSESYEQVVNAVKAFERFLSNEKPNEMNVLRMFELFKVLTRKADLFRGQNVEKDLDSTIRSMISRIPDDKKRLEVWSGWGIFKASVSASGEFDDIQGARLAKGNIKPISKQEAQDLVDEIGNRWALSGEEFSGRRLQPSAYEYLIGQKGILETVDSVFRKGDFPMPKRFLAVYLAALKASAAYDLGPDSRDFLLGFLATWMRDDAIYSHVKLFASRFGYTGNRNYLRMMGKIFRTARREVSLIESEPDRFEAADRYLDYERLARFYLENKAFVRVLFRRKDAVLTPEEKKVLRMNVLRRRPLSLEEIHRQTGLLMSDLPGYRFTALRKTAEEAARNASLFKFDINPEKLDAESVLKLGPFTAFGTLLVLEDLGIRTVADLLKKTPSEIYENGVWSFQNLPVEELRAKLARHRLSLKGDSSVLGARLAKTRDMDAVIDLSGRTGSLNALRIFSESFLVKFEQRIAEGLSTEIALGRMDNVFGSTGDRARRLETLSYLVFGEVLPEKAFFQRLDERKKEDLYILKNLSRAIHVLLQRGRYGKGEYTLRRLLKAYQRHFRRRSRAGESPLPDLDIALLNRVLDLAEGDIPSSGTRKVEDVRITVTDAMDETRLGFPGVMNLSDFPKGEMLEEALVKIRPHVLIVRSYTTVNESLIDRLLPDLKVIIRGGHGLDNVDVDYARLRDVEVYGTQGSEAAVAAWALRAVAAAEQDGLSYPQDAAPGSFFTIPEWTKALEKKVSKEKDPAKRKLLKEKAASLFAPVGRETIESLKGKTIGIIGFGSVGRGLAAAAKELGMNVLVNAPSLEKDPAPAAALGYKVVPKDTIYWLSHYIVLATGLYKEGPRRNVGMIGKAEVDIMLRNRNLIALVNPDREGLIDEKAVALLPEAGIQYLVDEVPDSGFLKAKARYTPHIAASTSRAEDGVVKNTAELLARVYPEVQQRLRGARLALDHRDEEPFIRADRQTPFKAAEHVKGKLSVRIEKDYDAGASGVNAQTTVIFVRDGATGPQDLMNIWRPLSEEAADTASKVAAALRPVKGNLTKKEIYASLYKYVKPLSLPNGARLAERTIPKEDALEFSLRVYDATRKTGQIALGDLVLDISIDPKTNALNVQGLGEPVSIADYKVAMAGFRKSGQGSVTLSMTELRQALGQDTAKVDAELADMDTTVPVVAEIDLTGFNNENAKELVFPLLVRELNIARKLNAVFLLKGDPALVREVLSQANALYRGNQNFVFEKDKDLPEAFRDGKRITLLAVNENSGTDLREGRHFFMKALGQADLPNFRAILKAVLYEARIENLETTDPRFIRFIRAYDVLLGSRSIDDISGFIHVLEGREKNIAAILKYAVQPRPIPINALVRVFSLMKRMAEQAA